METTTVSSKYQIIIPLNVRRALGIKPGQKIQVIAYGGRIELIPVEPIQSARGCIEGIETAIVREPDRV